MQLVKEWPFVPTIWLFSITTTLEHTCAIYLISWPRPNCNMLWARAWFASVSILNQHKNLAKWLWSSIFLTYLEIEQQRIYIWYGRENQKFVPMVYLDIWFQLFDRYPVSTSSAWPILLYPLYLLFPLQNKGCTVVSWLSAHSPAVCLKKSNLCVAKRLFSRLFFVDFERQFCQLSLSNTEYLCYVLRLISLLRILCVWSCWDTMGGQHELKAAKKHWRKGKEKGGIGLLSLSIALKRIHILFRLWQEETRQQRRTLPNSLEHKPLDLAKKGLQAGDHLKSRENEPHWRTARLWAPVKL